ncbi:MAG: hypothetical protein LBH00_08955 [Planctomycetaceae bacterium]|jgi:hypothetical protein|nr:hypothetical protein [Planctomycetaceae bacterium]
MLTVPFVLGLLWVSVLPADETQSVHQRIPAQQTQASSETVAQPPLTQEQLETIAIQPPRIQKETGNRVVPAMLPLFKELPIDRRGGKSIQAEL